MKKSNCNFQSSLHEWRFVFWVTFGVATVRTIAYLIWAKADVQPWNNSKDIRLAECDKLTENTENSTEKDALNC